MSYIKQTWVDRAVEFFRRFSVTEDSAGNLTLTEEPGIVTSAGTPLDATRLNHIENGIEEVSNNLNLVDNTVAAHLAESANKHIYESGSNANGKYIKFDDGTQICQHIISGNEAASVVSGIWTYPSSFFERPAGTISGLREANIPKSESTNLVYIDEFYFVGAEAIASFSAKTKSTVISGRQLFASVLAIGRWKA